MTQVTLAFVIAGCAFIGMVGQWVIAAVGYGKLQQRVTGHDKDLSRLEDSDTNQWNAINAMRDDHVQRITRIESWKESIYRGPHEKV